MNWLHTLWFSYVYPSIKGNGPDDVFFFLAGLILGRLIWPKVRKHLEFIKRQNAHIIKYHPDIPNEMDPEWQ